MFICGTVGPFGHLQSGMTLGRFQLSEWLLCSDQNNYFIISNKLMVLLSSKCAAFYINNCTVSEKVKKLKKKF